MEGLDFIKQEALKHGACNKICSVNTLEMMIKLLFSPQGREFCQKVYSPTLSHFREFKEVYSKFPGVFIDSGEIISTNILALAVGDTDLTLVCDSPTYLFKTIVVHGAKVKVMASNYAVVTITNIGGGVEVDSDDTCLISIEER